MSSKIVILEPHVANQIAAGEVIERPASVVKELVENAIDANSSRITVEIWNGGLDAIKVSDNGEGMSISDVKMAFLRHATSKIRYAEDLFNISTLGFRGEALPSIAAVSQVEVLTRPKDQIEGCRAVLKGGKVQLFEPTGCPSGTQIWVRDIFFNTPARKKFVKSLIRENSAVVNTVTRLALANPSISFKLIVDGRVIFHTSGNNNLLDVASSVYTVDIAKKMIFIKKEVNNITINGLMSQCHLYRANREMQNFFINSRYVHNLKLSKALEAGYRDKLPKNRYPLCILNFTIPADQLDVNVHPTKLEVRINKEEELCNCLTNLVSDSLLELNTVREIPMKPKPVIYKINSSEQLNLKLPETTVDYTVEEQKIEITEIEEQGSKGTIHESKSKHDKPCKEKLNYQEGNQSAVEDFPELIPIGQLHNTYILAQGDSGLYIIDQHAAHERIYYDEFKRKYHNGFYSQMLVVPISIELTYSEVGKLIDNILLFNSLGIIIEHFGDRTFILRGLPQGFTAQDGQELISYLISELDRRKIDELVRDDYIKLLACKRAIKANQKLTTIEMKHLLSKLSKTDFPYTCPHGRPTIITFSIREMEQKFLRG